MSNQHFYRYPFASAGDKTDIPEATQTDGSVSYNQGFGFDYERDPSTDPDAKNIQRDDFNGVIFDITENLQQYQLNGVPEWVPAAQNGGVAVNYPKFARVRYDTAGDGTGWQVFESAVVNNTSTPGADGNWTVVVNSTFFAADTGTANTYTAAYTPPLAGLRDGLVVGMTAKTANTGQSTFAPAGFPAKQILALTDLALQGGEIVANGHCLLMYSSVKDAWLLLENTGGTRQEFIADPANLDNSKRAVSSSWVKKRGVSSSTLREIGATSTLTSDDLGSTLLFNNAGGAGSSYTVNLPRQNTCPAGSILRIVCNLVSGSVLTVACQSPDKLTTPNANPSAIPLRSGDSLELTSQDGGFWVCSDGTVLGGLSDRERTLFSNTGYSMSRNGFIRQWTTLVTNSSGDGTFTFPMNYPNQVLGWALTVNASNPNQYTVTKASHTLAQLVVKTSSGGTGAALSVTAEVWGY